MPLLTFTYTYIPYTELVMHTVTYTVHLLTHCRTTTYTDLLTHALTYTFADMHASGLMRPYNTILQRCSPLQLLLPGKNPSVIQLSTEHKANGVQYGPYPAAGEVLQLVGRCMELEYPHVHEAQGQGLCV